MNKTIFFAPNIPSCWALIPNKYLFTYHSSKVGKNFAKYNLLSLTTRGVITKDINAKEGKLPASFEGYQTVSKGDMIFCLFDLDMSAVFSGLSGFNGMITSAYNVLRPSDKYLVPQYSDFWFQYVFSGRYYKNYSKNIRYTIGDDAFGQIVSPCPTLKEQKAIADFLNDKCSKIDSLISNQEKQIEKLKEYRQAIITKAVTKGLDPNAPMKDSGVEWIGNIPCNWETLKLKYCFSVRNEKYENGNYDYVALENVEPFSGKYKATESNAFYSLAETIRANRNDVIFGKLRPYLSKAFLIAKDCYVSSEFAVLYGLGGNRTSFLKYLLISSKFIDVINSSTYGTKMPRANIDFIRNLEIAIPDVKTQKEIVNYLDEACIKIDRLIDVKVRKIAQLSNYKRSLIYEYVTGKKRVSL